MNQEYDLRNTASLEESVRHSDVVYNLVGRDYPTKYSTASCAQCFAYLNRNFSLEDVHVEGAERIAEAVAKYDIDRFIHVSSHSADKKSPSEFYRVKARGEEVVRNIFPETTIVRPAPMFGFEDRLLHKLAGATNLFTSNHLQQRFWPVHVSHVRFLHYMPLADGIKVIDVATALSKMLEDDSTASETYELFGPTNYSMAEIAELVDKEIYKRRRHLNVPKRIMQPAAKLLNQLIWWKTTSADEVEREFLDQEVNSKAKTFADLDITPADLKNYTFHYLVSHVSRFSSSVTTAKTYTASIPQLSFLRSATRN